MLFRSHMYICVSVCASQRVKCVCVCGCDLPTLSAESASKENNFLPPSSVLRGRACYWHMDVCVSVFVYVCVCVCACACMCLFVNGRVCLYVCECVFVCV